MEEGGQGYRWIWRKEGRNESDYGVRGTRKMMMGVDEGGYGGRWGGMRVVMEEGGGDEGGYGGRWGGMSVVMEEGGGGCGWLWRKVGGDEGGYGGRWGGDEGGYGGRWGGDEGGYGGRRAGKRVIME